MTLSTPKKIFFCLIAILIPLICIELTCFAIIRVFYPQATSEKKKLSGSNVPAFRTDYSSNDFSKEDYDYSKDFFSSYLPDHTLILPERLIGPRAWKHYARIDHYTLFPFTMFHFQRNYRSVIVNTNNLGFRAKELSAYRKDQRQKIIILGGSAIFGTNLTSDAKTISAQLEAFLRQQGKDVTCINLAMGGFTSEHEMITLSRIGMRLNPSVVIALDGYNDILNQLRNRDMPHLYPRLATLFYGGIPPNSSSGVYFRELIHQWGRYSSFFYLAWVLSTHALPSNSPALATEVDNCILFPELSDHEAIIDNFINSHTVMHNLCKSRNIKYIAGLQPVCGLWVKPAWEGEMQYDINSESTFVSLYKLFDAKLEALAKKAGFPYLNYGKVLAETDNKYNFSDVVHLTDMSSGIVAQRLGEVILPGLPGSDGRPGEKPIR